MRFLLIPVIVLLITPFTYAGFLLSVNGDTTVESVTLSPSETITLDIYITEPLYAGGDLAIELSNAQGTLDASGAAFTDPVLTRVWFGAPYNMWADMDSSWEGTPSTTVVSPQKVVLSAGNTAWNTVGPYTLVDQIIYHCGGTGDVTVELIAVSDLICYQYDENGQQLPSPVKIMLFDDLLDTLSITQVPEPATLLLLGAGALMLRRKRSR